MICHVNYIDFQLKKVTGTTVINIPQAPVDNNHCIYFKLLAIPLILDNPTPYLLNCFTLVCQCPRPSQFTLVAILEVML